MSSDERLAVIEEKLDFIINALHLTQPTYSFDTIERKAEKSAASTIGKYLKKGAKHA
jgi:hypothetical protein